MQLQKIFYMIMIMLYLQACSGTQGSESSSSNTSIDDSSTDEISNPISVSSESQASAFLAMATFGTRYEDIKHLQSLGTYEAWVNEQIAIPPTYHYVNITKRLYEYSNWTTADRNNDGLEVFSSRRLAWLDISVNANDQLRQRVAFALSEMMVISDLGPLTGKYNDGIARYYDILVEHAFGNFRELLGDVSKNPMMGLYLGVTGNAKADPIKGNHADENYAREVMQLFSIGLENLNLDGSSQGTPAYTQGDIENLARVFTGWSGNHGLFSLVPTSQNNRTVPMKIYSEQHDSTSKTLFGKSIIAGLSTEADMERALDIIFEHPNVAPFVSKHLIMRLVTSNPTPSYVERVASVFNDDGKGVRGNLQAVVQAILLDNEALNGRQVLPTYFGKLREPLLRVTQLLRTFHATGDEILIDNKTYVDYNYTRTSSLRQQAALNSVTVFNYFSPTYKAEGTSFIAPEFQLAAPLDIAAQDNFMLLLSSKENNLKLNLETIKLHYDEEISLRTDSMALINRLDLLLMAGSMSQAMKGVLNNYILANSALDDATLISSLIGLIIISPEYAIQR